MILYQKRQDVLEAYQDFYEVRLPTMETGCTVSDKELNKAINFVRANYGERDYYPHHIDNGWSSFADLRYMNADE